MRQQWSVSIGKRDKRSVGKLGPVLLDDQLFAASSDGKVRKLNPATGKTLWVRDLQVTLTSGVAGDSTALYVADLDGKLYALQREDGKLLWEYAMSSEVLAPVAAGFGYLVARSADGRVTGLKAEDGSELWSNTYNPPALTLHGYSQPLLLPQGVLIGLDDGKLVALALKTGKTLWESELSYPSGRSEIERLVDIDADILIDNRYIYAVNYQGRLAQIEPARGRQTWSVDLSSIAGMSQNKTRLFVTDSTDRVVAVNKETGEIVWEQTQLTGRKLSRPVLLEKVVAVTDLEGYVHLLSLDDGSLVGRTRAGKDAVGVAPVADGSRLIVQSADQKLRMFSTESWRPVAEVGGS